MQLKAQRNQQQLKLSTKLGKSLTRERLGSILTNIQEIRMVVQDKR